ncbi:hypothetical protein HK405_009886 [Cladochytrium tenue]|nr:hypothetical protein HK405_009886 [Cladochytrium tenue]
MRAGELHRGLTVVGADDAAGAVESFSAAWHARCSSALGPPLGSLPPPTSQPPPPQPTTINAGPPAMRLPAAPLPPEAYLPGFTMYSGPWDMFVMPHVSATLPASSPDPPSSPFALVAPQVAHAPNKDTLALLRGPGLAETDVVVAVWRASPDPAVGLANLRAALTMIGASPLRRSHLPLLVLGVHDANTAAAATADANLREQIPCSLEGDDRCDRGSRWRAAAAAVAPFCAGRRPAGVLECCFKTGVGVTEACDAVRELLVAAPEAGAARRRLHALGLQPLSQTPQSGEPSSWECALL